MGNVQSLDTILAAFLNVCLAVFRKRMCLVWRILAVYQLTASMILNAAQSGDFTYTVSSSGCTITGYTGAGGNIDIPSSFTDGGQTYTVYGIGSRAFKACTNLTGVTIPGGVTSIGYEAFSGCFRLTRVIIPARVTQISYDTFKACSNLTSVTISAPKGYSVENGVFSGCTSLATVYFLGDCPSSVSSGVFQWRHQRHRFLSTPKERMGLHIRRSAGCPVAFQICGDG